MISRNLAIALLISLGAHVFGMTMVTIVNPGDLERTRPYTRVDFLGPILQKTAFDIMLENVTPIVRTHYMYTALAPRSEYLKVMAPKREMVVQEFPEHLENKMDILVLDFLTGSKGVPDFDTHFGAENFMPASWKVGTAQEPKTRRVIYRPDPPSVTRGLYGEKETFRIKIRVLVDKDGNVEKTEPLTTTGYPRLDITASKFVRGWIFEPTEDRIWPDEWQVVEVILNTGD
ncbi:energy transducer TonB [Candidatus Omnitrophota bacterium]